MALLFRTKPWSLFSLETLPAIESIASAPTLRGAAWLYTLKSSSIPVDSAPLISARHSSIISRLFHSSCVFKFFSVFPLLSSRSLISVKSSAVQLQNTCESIASKTLPL
jgi:hypothetical protein